jgi:hypothetical protein
MGDKSRGNWNLNFCFKDDCVNRNDVICSKCVIYDCYVSKEEVKFIREQVEDERLN